MGNTVLVVVSVVSTFVFAAVYVVLLNNYGINIICAEWLINSVCIVFMKTHYSKYYQFLCSPAEKCIGKCCKHEKNMRGDTDIAGLDSERTQTNSGDIIIGSDSSI